jgi:hypothetical protein
VAATDCSYVGPPIDDPAILAELPTVLRDLLTQTNGFVAHDGALHVRGACHAPTWHSLRYCWRSDDALHRQFGAIRPTDIPFAEDAAGNQFVLREGEVHRLIAESGELEALSMGVAGFLSAVVRDPAGFLALDSPPRFRADEKDGSAPAKSRYPDAKLP